MVEKNVQIKNPTGLHARPASIFSAKANEFQCDIKIYKDDRAANAKSILNIMSLGIPAGTIIKISADGPDENVAVEELAKIIASFED